MWQDIDSGLPEVLPTELLGWLMLMRCSLSPQQRLNVLSATGNSLKAEDIEQALRGAEDDLRVQESQACAERARDATMLVPTSGPSRVENGAYWLLKMLIFLKATWKMKDINAVYASTVAHPPLSLPGPDEPRWTAAEEGYWFQDVNGQFSFWTQHTDGEYYTQDAEGAYWTWDEFQEEAAWWNATPEQQKELSDAFAAYDAKVRTFMDSRDLMKSKGANRGYYKGKNFKGKKGLGKRKNKPSSAAGPSSAAAFQSQPSDVMASVGQAGYTGCFICPSKAHDFH